MTYEITRDLPLEDVEIETPMGKTVQKEIAGKKLTIVPILRAGMGMLNGVLEMVPSAKIAVIGMYRDEKTLKPHEYFFKAPKDIAERECLVVDPMLVEMKPNKRQNVFEYLLDFTNGIVKDNVSDVDAQKHLSLYAFVLFLFIWFMNQLGMFLEVKVDDWMFIKSPTADPVATMSFAMMTLLLSFTFGVQRFGVGGYLKNYAQPVGFLLPVNVIEEFTNFLTLSLRLYGNIYAGEVLLTLIGNDLAHAGGPFTLILAAPFAMIWQGFSVFIGSSRHMFS